MEESNNKFNDLIKTKDHTDEFDPADIDANKVMAVLAYLGILILIPIFAAKDSKFARFHANQSLVLWIFSIGVSVLLAILKNIPIIGIIASIASGGVSIVLFIFCVLGIINACSGKAKELPITGDIRILK